MIKKIEEISKKIMPILELRGVRRAGIFGSTARGEARGGSDVDILVDIVSDISLLEFIGLKQELEKKIGKKVDLVEYQTLKPSLREKILKEQVVIR